MSYNIAVDGPAGAGKSTIAKAVAKELGFIYVDTGAMYRAIGLYFLRHGVNPSDDGAVREALENIDISIAYEDGSQQVLLNGENVTGQIRTEEVSQMASNGAANPLVRQKLLELQQNLAKTKDVIMDGRDIGTCVLPNADLKIYLTASVKTRAKRRFLEMQEKNEGVSLEEIEKDIQERDYRDIHRETAPLKQADDAVLVDSSEMTADEVVQRILSLTDKNK